MDFHGFPWILMDFDAPASRSAPGSLASPASPKPSQRSQPRPWPGRGGEGRGASPVWGGFPDLEIGAEWDDGDGRKPLY